MRKLVDLDADLSSFVTRLEGHQRLQDEVKSVQMKLLDQEVSIMDFTRQLGEKQDGLNELLDTARETLQEADESRNEPINVDELISYSIKIAKYTMDSEIPDRPHEPPIPQDHHMRHSLLFQGGHAMGVAAPAETEATDGTVKTPEPVHSDTMLADFGAHSPGKDAEQPHVDHEELLDLDL
ncbi:mediator complex, subunit Med4 [Phlyctochytrium arcticum]|nr:mediator complex, subunit Med4 [Phlyctochytrium arcticum]